jgi:hypothetical protein
MSETPNFSEILDTRIGDIEAPKDLPPGQYDAITTSWKDMVSKQGTRGFEYEFKLLRERQVSDQEALVAAGGAAGKTKRHTFWMSNDEEKVKFSKHILKQFLTDTLRIPAKDDQSLRELMQESVNKSVVVDLRTNARVGADG